MQCFVMASPGYFRLRCNYSICAKHVRRDDLDFKPASRQQQHLAGVKGDNGISFPGSSRRPSRKIATHAEPSSYEYFVLVAILKGSASARVQSHHGMYHKTQICHGQPALLVPNHRRQLLSFQHQIDHCQSGLSQILVTLQVPAATGPAPPFA